MQFGTGASRPTGQHGSVGIYLLGAVGVVVVLTLLLFPFYTDSTQTAEIGLSYGGGPFEAKKFQRVVQPASGRFINGWWDKLYKYPTTQRNYIISKLETEGDRHGKDWITTISKDGIPIDFEIAVYFKLNTDVIKQFHEQIGLKYGADGDEGWDRMLNDYVRQQIEETVQNESRRFSAEAMYSDQGTLDTLSKTIGPIVNQRILAKAGGNYFCNPDWTPGKHCGDFTVTIKKADIANDEVKAAFAKRREAEIAIQTERNKVEQARQQAEAIRVLNRELQRSGNSYLYVLLEAIKSGKIDFWVLPSDSKGLTLQAPQRGQ